MGETVMNMDFNELLGEISFMREMKKKIREKITELEKQRYADMDYDTRTIYSGYLEIERKLEALIRYDYDCEKKG